MALSFDLPMTTWGGGDRRAPTEEAHALQLQRVLAERLLLKALRDDDAADVAEILRRDATWLAAEGKRLADSLDEATTLYAMARMALPYLGAWCIVDSLGEDGSMRRAAMAHLDPAKQAVLDGLHERWMPAVGDTFGLPAVIRGGGPIVIAAAEVDAALQSAAHDPDIDVALHALGIGGLLTVPLKVRDEIVGAITYVADEQSEPFTAADIRLGEDLANRGAMALDRARIYGMALEMKMRAEAATHVKSEFLGMMSHELRTPLNAIGGYLDLMDMEIHGPITPDQRLDIERIRFNQRYLTALISDLLNFTKVGSGQLRYETRDVVAADVITASIALVQPLIEKRELVLAPIKCDSGLVFSGDRERVIQIMVNLLSNSIKFTPVGGRITVSCAREGDRISISVADTGIGIPADKLEAIFEPFVQIKDLHHGPDTGIGLGLAISRGLAQGMQGDLTVVSRFGEGTRFTLSVPRPAAATMEAQAQ
jgi:signal transduction histidine kinase